MQRALPAASPIRIRRVAPGLFSAALLRPWPALAVLALGVVLRGLLLDRLGLHPDEALYASWALRIASGSDPALLGVYVDKPPLLLYLMAGLFRLAGFDGAAPFDAQRLIVAGRLAALLASAASLTLVWLIGRRVYGPLTALVAMLLFAASPLAVRLSPTLFTDPWLVLWMLLGLWAALDRRAWLAGAACGLAYATKQQAVLLAPLILIVLLLNQRWPLPSSMARPVGLRHMAWRWLCGSALIAVAVLWWDSLRWQWMPSYWDRSALTYGGVALALDASLPQRLAQWGELLGYGFGWPLWLALAALLLAARVARRQSRDASAPSVSITGCHSQANGRTRWFGALLLVYVGAYLLLHAVTNLAPWDRYLLPILPLLALLLACATASAADALRERIEPQGMQRRIRPIAAAGLAAGVVYASAMVSFAQLPLADGGIYDGVAPVASHIRTDEPPSAVVYHHWLGWHYGFYLYDAPVELRWWEGPTDLARKAVASAGQRQLMAFPAGREQGSVREALAERGLALIPVMVATDARGAPSVALYSIEPVTAGATTDGR